MGLGMCMYVFGAPFESYWNPVLDSSICNSRFTAGQ